MTQLPNSKVTEIFFFIDEFCKEYRRMLDETGTHEVEDGKRHRNRAMTMSESEIMTILVMFHFGSYRNFKHFYLFGICEHWKGEFPDRFSYSRFVQVEHRVLVPLMLFLKMVGFGKCTGITFVDSTKIAVCHNKRIRRNKTFRGIAEVGKSTMGWFYGFKLHLVCNDKGELLEFCLTKANVDDRNADVFKVLCKELFGKLYADKGYISQSLLEMLFEDGIHLVTGIKSNMKNKLMSLKDKILLRKRSVIETVNDELKNICQIEHSRHRSVANFLMNLIAALTAYSFFEKKPAIKYDVEPQNGQLQLFC